MLPHQLRQFDTLRAMEQGIRRETQEYSLTSIGWLADRTGTGKTRTMAEHIRRNPLPNPNKPWIEPRTFIGGRTGLPVQVVNDTRLTQALGRRGRYFTPSTLIVVPKTPGLLVQQWSSHFTGLGECMVIEKITSLRRYLPEPVQASELTEQNLWQALDIHRPMVVIVTDSVAHTYTHVFCGIHWARVVFDDALLPDMQALACRMDRGVLRMDFLWFIGALTWPLDRVVYNMSRVAHVFPERIRMNPRHPLTQLVADGFYDTIVVREEDLPYAPYTHKTVLVRSQERRAPFPPLPEYDTEHWFFRLGGEVSAAAVADGDPDAAEDMCGICLDDVQASKRVQTSCKHVFCLSCITTWYRRNRSCPCCRTAGARLIAPESAVVSRTVDAIVAEIRRDPASRVLCLDVHDFIAGDDCTEWAQFRDTPAGLLFVHNAEIRTGVDLSFVTHVITYSHSYLWIPACNNPARTTPLTVMYLLCI